MGRHPLLSDETVIAIREAYVSGEPIRNIAGRLGVSVPTICQIAHGRRRRNVGGPISPPRRESLTEADVKDIRERADNGESYVSISRTFGREPRNISDIVRGKSFTKFGDHCSRCGTVMNYKAELCGLCELDEMEARGEMSPSAVLIELDTSWSRRPRIPRRLS